MFLMKHSRKRERERRNRESMIWIIIHSFSSKLKKNLRWRKSAFSGSGRQLASKMHLRQVKRRYQRSVPAFDFKRFWTVFCDTRQIVVWIQCFCLYQCLSKIMLIFTLSAFRIVALILLFGLPTILCMSRLPFPGTVRKNKQNQWLAAINISFFMCVLIHVYIL